MVTDYHQCTTFQVLGFFIHLYSEKLGYGYSTVAEVGDQLHYLGDEPANIATAIFAWEELNGRSMSQQELKQVLLDNNILSGE